MKKEDIKHIEVLLQSYKVMVKTLEIRLELITGATSSNLYLKEVLEQKLTSYRERVLNLEKKLQECK